MAWEEESVDPGADFEDMGGGGLPIKKILIIVIALAVLGAGGYFGYTMFMKGDDEAAEEEQGEAAVEEEEVAEAGVPVEIEEFLLNVTGADEPTFLKAKFTLEVSSQELADALNGEGEGATKLLMAKTRDRIINVLREKTLQELNDPNNQKEIGKEIQFRLNDLYKDGKVINVLVTNWITT